MTSLQWFGHRYDAPAWIDMPKADVSVVGRRCLLCTQVFMPDDDGLMVPDAATGKRSPVHVPCFLDNLGIKNRPERSRY